jgi:hypothetical protein
MTGLSPPGRAARLPPRFGREANQEVVVVELSGYEGSWFFRIKRLMGVLDTNVAISAARVAGLGR